MEEKRTLNRVGLDSKLIREWHPTKNGDLSLSDLTPGSGRKVWWRCSTCGYEWQAALRNRLKGTGCPPCSVIVRAQKRAVPKTGNSLEERFPNLAREWDAAENGLMKPSEVSSGSSKRAWWICPTCGNSWQASICSRSSGNGCSKCYNLQTSERIKTPSPGSSLADLYPELIAEWDPEANGSLTPYRFKPHSGEKVWWLCKTCANKWWASIAKRVDGRGCPHCKGSVISKKKSKAPAGKSLAETRLDLLEEWHKEKNSKLSPFDIMPQSNKTVWWKCKICGWDWRAKVYNLANGRGCPACSGRIATPSSNLATLYPELIKEWHSIRNGTLNPNALRPGSNKKVWWQCSRCTREWEASVASRVNGRGCPNCKPQTSRPEIRLYVELKTIFEEVKWRFKIKKIECDIYIPDYKMAIEYDGKRWHEAELTRDLRKNKKLKRLGITLLRVREKGLNPIGPYDLITREAELTVQTVQDLLRIILSMATLPVIERTLVYSYLERDAFSNDEEFQQLVSSLPGPLLEESVACKYPNLVPEFHHAENAPSDLTKVSIGSKTKAWWRCPKCGYEWSAAINSRCRGHGCPACAGQVATPENNLALKYPILVTEWHLNKNGNLAPTAIAPKSGKKIWWRCPKCDYEWQARVYSRTNGAGCPACSGRVATPTNNIAIKSPGLVKLWNTDKNGPLTPQEVTPQSNKKYLWLCDKCGREWKQKPARVDPNGCPDCSKRHKLRDSSLAVANPELIKSWDWLKNEDIDPYLISSGSGKKAWWKCPECNYSWSAQINSRNQGRGCPECGRRRPRRTRERKR